MRILLDTNIVIHREASKVYNQEIGLLFNWIDKLKYEKCVHPLTLEEISKYKDKDAVDTMKIKIENYNLIKTESPETDPIIQLRYTDKNRNDYIDTSLLKEVLNHRVDLFITEDKGIHKKAEILGIIDCVFTIETFIERCTMWYPELKDYNVLSVKKEYFGNLDLKDPFFESFLQDYLEFETWFNRKADNISYVCMIDDEIKAFLYLKVEIPESENYIDISPKFSPKKRLKIGTFKVTSTGLRLGERFLKIIFDNAIANNVDEIYVTIFDKRDEQKRLITLLSEWGFKDWGVKETKNGTEKVYVRDFSKIILDNPRYCYPYVKKSSNVYITPIKPEYHTELFPDSILKNESPLDFIESEPHRNALKKVYFSRSIFRSLVAGDLILFYRTGGYRSSVISTLGVVESVVQSIRSEAEFIKLCHKRSIFKTDKELQDEWNRNEKLRPFIVNFLYVDSFPMPKVNLKRLIEIGVIASTDDAPRGFVQLENSKFNIFLKEARANENYIID